MYSRVLCLLMVLSTIAGSVLSRECIQRNKHPILVGRRVSGDRELLDDIVLLSINYGVGERDVHWSSTVYEITHITITDMEEEGGCAEITSGGFGEKFVVIHLESPVNGSAFFHIYIYGKLGNPADQIVPSNKTIFGVSLWLLKTFIVVIIIVIIIIIYYFMSDKKLPCIQ